MAYNYRSANLCVPPREMPNAMNTYFAGITERKKLVFTAFSLWRHYHGLMELISQVLRSSFFRIMFTRMED